MVLSFQDQENIYFHSTHSYITFIIVNYSSTAILEVQRHFHDDHYCLSICFHTCEQYWYTAE